MTAPVLKNRAGVTCTTTGTGTITLGSALTSSTTINQASWQTLASAGVTNGQVVRYLILDSNGAWEYGTGTYTTAGTTLSRTLGASSTGSLLSLSASSQVFVAAVAEDIVPFDSATGTLTVGNASGGFIGVGGAANIAGWGAGNNVLTVVSPLISVTEYATNAADASGTYIGFFDFTYAANTLGPTEVVQLLTQSQGTTAQNRGGSLTIRTKADGGIAGPVDRFYVGSAGDVQVITNIASTSSGTGSLTTAGGLGVVGSIVVDGNFGGDDIASPVARTLQAQSVIAGTSNTAGADLSITGSKSTGTGAGGKIVFKTAPAGTTGTAQNAAVQAGYFDSAGSLTVTNSISSGNAFFLSSSRVLGLLGNYNTFFDAAGNPRYLIADPINDTTSYYDGTTHKWRDIGATPIFASLTSTVLQLGDDIAAPVAKTIQAQSVVAGTSNIAGADFSITGSKSTGSGRGGDIIFKTAPAGGSGTSQNAAVEVGRTGFMPVNTQQSTNISASANSSTIVSTQYVIAAGNTLTLGAGATLRII